MRGQTGPAVHHIPTVYGWCEGPVRGRASGATLGNVAYWVLKAILTPIFFVLWRVKVEGR
jgi:hypothetical protein